MSRVCCLACAADFCAVVTRQAVVSRHRAYACPTADLSHAFPSGLLSPAAVLRAGGLLLRLSGLLLLLQLLPQDQAVDGDAGHVRALLPAGDRHLRPHDVPHRGPADESAGEYPSRCNTTRLALEGVRADCVSLCR